MDFSAVAQPVRRPRFRRASEPPAFRLTDDDVEIVRVIARHRLIRSTHIAALVGRSLDRTNDRLMRLFHAGYIDRQKREAEKMLDDEGLDCEFDFAALMRGDANSRATYYSAMVSMGALTRNEVRVAENYTPLPGLDEVAGGARYPKARLTSLNVR